MSKVTVNMACGIWAVFFLLTVAINLMTNKSAASDAGVLIGTGALLGIGVVALCINLFIPSNSELTSKKLVSPDSRQSKQQIRNNLFRNDS